MLLFENVTKKYTPDITALEDVTFNIDTGEFSFLVGPSGAGKTTLLKLLIREELPTAGSIFFEDVEITKLPKPLIPKYRQRLGVVFQDIKLLPSKTLEENVAFALEILGKPDKEIKETTSYLLNLVKLENRRSLFPVQLSGGEQQRGAIARALASDPDLLIADEPTGNLDPDNSFQILEILRNINKSGTTVMVISHDKEIVDFMKTRVIRIENGKVISDNKGDYDTIKKPKKPSVIHVNDEVKTDENIEKTPKPKTQEKEPPTPDDSIKNLDRKVLKKLLQNGIINIDMILKLTEDDLKNMNFNNKEEKKLEDFVRDYLLNNSIKNNNEQQNN